MLGRESNPHPGAAERLPILLRPSGNSYPGYLNKETEQQGLASPLGGLLCPSIQTLPPGSRLPSRWRLNHFSALVPGLPYPSAYLMLGAQGVFAVNSPPQPLAPVFPLEGGCVGTKRFPPVLGRSCLGGFQVHWPSLMGGSEGSAPWCIGLSIPLHLLCSYGMFPQLWAPAEEGEGCASCGR